MYKSEALKNLVYKDGLSQKEIILIALGCNGGNPKSASDIKNLLTGEAGLKAARKYPVSTYLNRKPIWAIDNGGNWELTDDGVNKLKEMKLHTKSGLAVRADDNLSEAIEDISDEHTKAFVDEALQCYRNEFYRAATLLSWVGAMHCMFVFVHKNKLSDFNVAAKARFDNPPKVKWKDIKTVEGFANIKESNFLQVMADLQLIGSSVKKKLDKQLDLRNGCGHPNGMVVGEHEVAAHLEILIGNIFKKFL